MQARFRAPEEIRGQAAGQILPDRPALRGRFLHNESMAGHVSWRAGGPAQRIYVPADMEDLRLLLQAIPEDEAVHMTGLGSNLLVRDGGVRGVVVLMHGALNRLALESRSLGLPEAPSGMGEKDFRNPGGLVFPLSFNDPGRPGFFFFGRSRRGRRNALFFRSEGPGGILGRESIGRRKRSALLFFLLRGMGGNFLLFSSDGRTPNAALGVLLYLRRFNLWALIFLNRGFGEGAFNPLGGCFSIEGNLFEWSRG